MLVHMRVVDAHVIVDALPIGIYVQTGDRCVLTYFLARVLGNAF
jgi:hypothetical protein